MAHLGLELRNSRWAACVIDPDGTPQEIPISGADNPAALASCLPTQKWQSVVLSLPSAQIREGDVARSLQHQLQEALGVGNVRLIPHPVAVAVCATWSAAPLPAVQGQDLLIYDLGDDESTATFVRRGPDELPFVVREQRAFCLSGEQVDSHLFEALSQSLGWTGNSVSAATRTRAMETVAELRQTISRNLERAIPGRKIISAKATWVDDKGNEHNVVLSAELYLATLEPLFASARAELEAFLRAQPQPPSSITLSGEATRTFGIKQHLLEPVLHAIYGNEVAVRLANALCVLNTFSQNAGVAGAALVAANSVPYQELLPCDIGARMKVEANGALAQLLQLPPDTREFWLYPLLPRGAALPARFNSTNLGLVHLLDPGENLDWDVRWELEGRTFRHSKSSGERPTEEKPIVIEWQVEADAGGRLRTSFGEHGTQQGTVQEIALFDSVPEVVGATQDIPLISLIRLQELLSSAENWQ